MINVTPQLFVEFPLHTIFIAVAGKQTLFHDTLVKKTKEVSLAAVRFRAIG